MNTQLPEELINAVLAKSAQLPEGTPVVKGYDFCLFLSFRYNFDNGIDLTGILESYATMGFQATNMSAAIDEINRMVFLLFIPLMCSFTGDFLTILLCRTSQTSGATLNSERIQSVRSFFRIPAT